MNCCRQIRLNSIRLLAMMSACAASFAAEDDVVVEGNAVEVNAAANGQMRFVLERQLAPVRVARVRMVEIRLQNLNDTRFEGEIFRQDVTAQRGRWRMNSELDAAIKTIERACQLTDAQKRKLLLVGRADRKRFFDRLEALQEQSRSENGLTQEMQAEMQAEREALRKTAEAGLLGPDSFFAKAIQSVLTPEQLEECQTADHLILIERTVAAIEPNVRLQPSQREALVKLIRDEIPAGAIFWGGDGFYRNAEMKELRRRLTSLADEKVKPLLNDVQWQNLRSTIDIDGFDPRVLVEIIAKP